MDSPKTIEIIPIIEDNYYRTIVYDVEVNDAGGWTKFVRDIYHSDSLADAINLLHQLYADGTIGG